MKGRFLLGYSTLFLYWMDVAWTASANILVADQILRISTAHHTPYMYQDNYSKLINRGVEFQLLQTLAQTLNVPLYVRIESGHSDICNSVAGIASDICIGGIFPKEIAVENAVMSVAYATDQLTWCVRKAENMPFYLSSMYILQPTVWFLMIFAFVYMSGCVLYLRIQFDRNYEQRNNRDFHQMSWLVALPAVIGISSHFQPVGWITRLFFGMVLVTGFFVFQLIFSRLLDFLNTPTPWHQVSSFDDLIAMGYHFAGSVDAYNVLNQSRMIPTSKIGSMQICKNISECLELLLTQKNVAIAGSRENILSSPLYSPSQVFCFHGLENIADYPIVLYMKKDFHLKEKVNTMIQRLFEAGFLDKWKNDAKINHLNEPPSYGLPLSVLQMGAPLAFLIGCGCILSVTVFLAENIVLWKMKQRSRSKIWVYLEQLFDGRRHYLTDLPERSELQNERTAIQFPYLE